MSPIGKTNELELAQRCTQGDNLARKELYERYAAHLLAICIRYIGDRELAQDVLHDGFILLFRSFDKFSYQGEGSLKAWMSRIMINEALGYLRRNKSLHAEVQMEELPDVEEELEEDVNELPESLLLKWVGELPDGYRAVFNLYVFEEKSHKEIAQLLGITEHTSSSQLFRAKSKLMKRITEYKEEKKDGRAR
ncbi:MAG: RNA polymerase sigma factor [Phocaeicola sp.]